MVLRWRIGLIKLHDSSIVGSVVAYLSITRTSCATVIKTLCPFEFNHGFGAKIDNQGAPLLVGTVASAVMEGTSMV
jgi:hypothetical protein